jgi:hypothetical protein
LWSNHKCNKKNGSKNSINITKRTRDWNHNWARTNFIENWIIFIKLKTIVSVWSKVKYEEKTTEPKYCREQITMIREWKRWNWRASPIKSRKQKNHPLLAWENYYDSFHVIYLQLLNQIIWNRFYLFFWNHLAHIWSESNRSHIMNKLERLCWSQQFNFICKTILWYRFSCLISLPRWIEIYRLVNIIWFQYMFKYMLEVWFILFLL